MPEDRLYVPLMLFLRLLISHLNASHLFLHSLYIHSKQATILPSYPEILEDYKDLYSFWKEKITNYLNNQDIDFILNLASKEYSDTIDKEQVKAKWVNCNFYDFKNNEFKIIGNYAKAARGLMVDFIVKNKITSVQGIKQFNVNNYRFDEDNSTSNELKFIRKISF